MPKQESLWKLTTKNWTTRNNTKWGPNVTHIAYGKGELCTSHWLHAYRNPVLAVIIDPAHGSFGEQGILWEARGIVERSDGLKVGCTTLTTVKVIEKPKVSIEQKVAFGILCSLEVYRDEKFQIWAKNWLSGKDRTRKSAAAADYAAAYAAYAAAAAAYADDAAYAAYAASSAKIAGFNINFEDILEKALKIK